MTYVFHWSEAYSRWEVGYYAPDGSWKVSGKFYNREDARREVHYLNGGGEE